MSVTVFYSWQSDTRSASNRSLIQKALEDAVAELRDDDTIAVEPAVDRDTAAVAGAPDIGATILEKIDSCSVFVADVTIVSGRESGRPAPNPNVLIELGYALKTVGWPRCVFVQNVAYGGPELLPFDLRQKRALTYDSPEEAETRAPERDRLQAQLRDAIRLILESQGVRTEMRYPVALTIDYDRVRTTPERHDYRLRVELSNESPSPIKAWHVDTLFPTALLDERLTYSMAIADRSDKVHTLFRSTPESYGGLLYPGDKRVVLSLPYYVDARRYDQSPAWSNLEVSARAYVAREATEAVKYGRDIHDF